MKQNFIFVIILLATLSIVNAIPHQLLKRETVFAPCHIGSLNIIKVTVQPDPPPATGTLIFSISGTIKTGIISAGSRLVLRAIDNAGVDLDDPLVYEICKIPGFTCPANYFSITRSVDIKGLTPTYSVIVQLFSATGQSLGCSIGTITGN